MSQAERSIFLEVPFYTRAGQSTSHKRIQNVKHVLFESGKEFISHHILHKYWDALLVRRNSQYRGCVTVDLATSAPPTPLYATDTSHRKEEIFLYVYPLHSVFCPQKRTTERCSSVEHIQARSSFWLQKATSEHAHARLLPRLPWSWTVLLSSDNIENYYVHYSCFTSICGLFTDSPSYLHYFCE
jgi:hypothetical protein